ncbi:MAG: pilus assembly protein PilM [Planctomycetes bacterium]|nr:pilus assembly protein PilM [Planctomycetota bacterium]
MARSIGLDLGSHSVKILGLETAGKRFRITRFVDRVLPRTVEEGDATAVVARAFKELKLPRDLVVMGFDAYASILREMTVPFRNPDQIRKIIRYESEGQLFSFGIDEVVVDFVKVRENPDSSDLIVVAVVKQLLAERLRTVESAYVDPISVDLDLLAHYNALAITPYPEQHPTLGLLDVGYKSTKLLVVEKGRPVLLRGTRVGLGSIVAAVQQETGLGLVAAEDKVAGRLAALAEALEVPDAGDDLMVVLGDDEELPEASDLHRGPDDLEDELVADKTAAVRAKVVREVNRSLAGLKTAAPVELLLLTGGGARIPGLARALTTSLGIETRPFDILSHVDHPFAAEERAAVEPFVPVAIGLALKQLGKNASGTEFRREELAFQKRFEQVKVPLTICLGLMLMFLGLVFYRFRSEYKLRRQEYDILTWQIVNTLANVMQERPFLKYVDENARDENGNPRVVLERIRSERLGRHRKLRGDLRSLREDLNRELGKLSDTEEHRCALDTWNEVCQRLRAAHEALGTDLSPIVPYIRFDQDGANCNLIVRDYPDVEALQRAFAASDKLLMGEARGDKPPPKGGVPGANPRVLTQQQFTFKTTSPRR